MGKKGNSNKCRICIPVIEETKEEILKKIEEIQASKADMMEWRCDFFENANCIDKVVDVLKEIRKISDKKLIFTYRTKSEGGKGTASVSEYLVLLKTVCLTKHVDFIDVQFMMGDAIVESVRKHAHVNNIKVILSNHDFENTPREDILEKRMRMMDSKDVDVVKGAYMPKTLEDVDMVKNVCMKLHDLESEYVLISMSELGVETRMKANELGCAFTFASLEKKSAPGQMEIEELLKAW